MTAALKPKILVIDDDQSFLDAVSLALSQHGEVKTATNLDQLKRLIAEASDWHVVITDYRMSSGDGFSVVSTIRNLIPKIPIIVATAFAEKEMAIQFLNLRIFAFLEKPVDFFELCETVQKALSGSSESTFPLADKTVTQITSGRTVLDPSDFSAVCDGTRFQLTETEFRILFAFVSSGGRRISRDEIIYAVWGRPNLSSNLFDTHLLNLRKKIPALKNQLKVVRGKGYIFHSEGPA